MKYIVFKVLSKCELSISLQPIQVGVFESLDFSVILIVISLHTLHFLPFL